MIEGGESSVDLEFESPAVVAEIEEMVVREIESAAGNGGIDPAEVMVCDVCQAHWRCGQPEWVRLCKRRRIGVCADRRIVDG